jgi:4-hydroxybenzoate polyprenyltransferase
MSPARAVLVTLRPHQWVKNLFVVAPLVFSKNLFETTMALRTLGAVAAFCALSGAVYAFNDVRDAEDDRAHPTKKNRPVASGALSERGALITAALLVVLALGGCFALSWKLGVVAAGYASMNLAYSLALKKVPVIDVVIIAAGFLLRVTGGAYAIDVPISEWLLACTGLLAALLGFGKRAHELRQAFEAGRDPRATRAALAGYSMRFLGSVLGLLAVATCAAYAFYTQDARTLAFFGTRELIWTLPFCIIGIGRFLQLTISKTGSSSPTDAILRDWPFLLNLAVWGAVVLFIIYGAR